MRTSIVLVAGLVLIAASVGVALARSPTTLAGTNHEQGESVVGLAEQPIGACQAGETLLAGTSAIRLSLVSIIGAKVTVQALSGRHVITHGSTGAGWTGSEVTVPVSPVARTAVPHVKVCFDLSNLNGEVKAYGQDTGQAVAAVGTNGQDLHGRFGVEYVRAGHASWASLTAAVIRRMSLGRAWSSVLIVYFTLALALTMVGLTSWGIVRELR